jgi:Ser/Thr protein kinase RdoA (MazF antagonist)
MDVQNIHSLLSCNYGMDAQSIKLNREGGNVSYVIDAGNNTYFLKIIRPPFLETALQSVDIQMYLKQSLLPVIPIVLSQAGTPYVRAEVQGRECIFVLYDYIEGGEPDPEDTEKAGALIGRLHQVIKVILAGCRFGTGIFSLTDI